MNSVDLIMSMPPGEEQARALSELLSRSGVAQFARLNAFANRTFADDPNVDVRAEIQRNYATILAGAGAMCVQARMGTLQRGRLESTLAFLARQNFAQTINEVLLANQDLEQRDWYVAQKALRDLTNTPDVKRQHYWTGERDDEN